MVVAEVAEATPFLPSNGLVVRTSLNSACRMHQGRGLKSYTMMVCMRRLMTCTAAFHWDSLDPYSPANHGPDIFNTET